MKYEQSEEVGSDQNNWIYGELDKCGHCGGSLRGPSGIIGVKAGFRLFHKPCVSKYQKAMEGREKALQGPSRGNVTVLPPCLDTEGWYDWTHGKANPDGIDCSIYDRAITRRGFTWY